MSLLEHIQKSAQKDLPNKSYDENKIRCQNSIFEIFLFPYWKILSLSLAYLHVILFVTLQHKETSLLVTKTKPKTCRYISQSTRTIQPTKPCGQRVKPAWVACVLGLDFLNPNPSLFDPKFWGLLPDIKKNNITKRKIPRTIVKPTKERLEHKPKTVQAQIKKLVLSFYVF